MRDVREREAMNKKFDVGLDYLEHDGGTKFYETVLIREIIDERASGFAPSSQDPAILIQRWGKIEANTGGGQIKTVKGSLTVCANERERILNDKQRAKPGKGEYVKHAPSAYGLGRTINCGSSKVMDDTELGTTLAEHYGSGATSDMIMKHFGTAGEQGQKVADGIAEEENEQNRGTHWASW